MNEWAQRWRRVLHDAPGDIPRRARQGETLVRASRVSDVRVGPGRLSGSVQGSRATPHVVDIEVPQLDDDAWRRIGDAVAGQVRHSARLLAGQAPDGLAAELEAAGVRLFPSLGELDVRCACGEGMCAHAAGVWEAVAEQIAQDPFTLPLLRGRGRQRLLDDVSARRGSATPDEPAGLDPAALDVHGWWEARAPLADVPAGRSGGKPVPALRVLGDPPGWAGGVSAEDLFGPLARRGAAWARALLDAESRAGEETVDAEPSSDA